MTAEQGLRNYEIGTYTAHHRADARREYIIQLQVCRDCHEVHWIRWIHSAARAHASQVCRPASNAALCLRGGAVTHIHSEAMRTCAEVERPGVGRLVTAGCRRSPRHQGCDVGG